jgi:hypothetical protein
MKGRDRRMQPQQGLSRLLAMEAWIERTPVIEDHCGG